MDINVSISNTPNIQVSIIGGGGSGGVGSGTVTSVGLALPTAIFDVSGSPVTTAGTLTATLDNQSANQVFAGPASGAATTPGFRVLVADDIPSLDTAKLTSGTLGITRGGTGLSALGTANQLIRVNAGATALEYFTPTYLTGNETITLSGDASGSGTTGITVTIANDAVTFAKMQNIATGVLLGRSTAATGDIETISVGSGLSLSGGTLSATGGTVTSVALSLPTAIFDVTGSPVTTSGTLTATLDNQSANQVFAGPASGAATTPGFRALVSDDIPSLDTAKLTSGTLGITRGGTGLSALGTANQLIRVNAGATALEYFTPTYLTGNETITLSGDASGSGTTGITVTIANDAVTFAKMQNIATGVLLGRSTAATGDIETISVGSGLSLSGGTLSATGGGSGTVTSVALSLPTDIFDVSGSPVTTSGTLTATLDNQSANQVFAGPASGAATTPGFRALVSDDIPSLDTSKLTSGTLGITRGGTGLSALGTANQLIRVNAGATALEYFTPSYLTGNETITLSGDASGSGTTGITVTIANDAVTFAKMQNIATGVLLGRSTAATGDIETISVGSGLSLSGGTLSATGGGSGTVTSVGLSLPTAIFDVSGSPVTTSGTLTATLDNQSANQVFAGPASGAATTPGFRALVSDDIPSLDTAKLTSGTLGITRGGTGLSALGTANQLIRVNAGATALEYFTPTYLTGNETITLSGDASGSGTTGITVTIANDAVTFAKMQNIATGVLLGRSTAATGDIETISVGSGLSLSGGTLSATGGGSGTVTSVALSLPTDIFDVSGSPVTTSGTLTATLDNQSANQVFAGPASGAATTPGFRALVSDDIPSLDTSKLTSGTLGITRGGTGLSALGTANQLIRVNAGATALEYFTPAYLTGNETITLSGDASGSGTTGITVTIANDAVTFAKMQNIATGVLLGRSTAATGDIETISIGTGLSLSGGTLSGTSSSVGGSTGQVQYNNGGAFDGAAGVKIDSNEDLNLSAEYTTTDAATPADGVTLYSKVLAGQTRPAFVNDEGLARTIQPAIFQSGTFFWQPVGSGVTTVSGLLWLNSVTGTLTARSVATTNYYTQARRVGYVSAASAGSSCGNRHNATLWFLGDAADKGGFFASFRFAHSDSSYVSDSRTFVGFTTNTSALSSGAPSALTNIIAMAYDSGQTTFRIMHNDGSGTATTVDLGANFPSNTAQTDVYDVMFYAKPNSGQVEYQVIRLNTGDHTTGTITTDLPSSTTLLSAQVWRNNGSTASAVGIDIVHRIYIETFNQ